MSSTVARWPKMQQNNFEGVVKNMLWPRNFGDRTATNFSQRLSKKAGKFCRTVSCFLNVPVVLKKEKNLRQCEGPSG